MNPRPLSHFASKSVGGLTFRGQPEKSQKVSDSHRNDMSPLTQGLRYRAACDNDRSFPLCGHPVCVLHKLHNHRENALKHYSVRLLLCQMTGACVNSRKEAIGVDSGSVCHEPTKLPMVLLERWYVAIGCQCKPLLYLALFGRNLRCKF